MRQEQYKPYKQYEQVIILVVVLNHLLQDVPVSKVKTTMSEILQYIKETHFDIIERIENTHILSDEDKCKIIEIAKHYLREK